jgi:hypothetical protein
LVYNLVKNQGVLTTAVNVALGTGQLVLKEKRILRSATDSLSRIAEAKTEVAKGLDATSVARHVQKLTKPNSPSAAMKKAGVALIVAPDPVTGVAGVALVASSFVLKGKEPASLAHLAQEARRVLRDVESIRL